MINSAKHCTINQYMEAYYENNLSVLGEGTEEEQKAALQQISIQFADLSGSSAESPDFPLRVAINKLEERIMIMTALLYTQRHCLALTGEPILNRLNYFETYNHKPVWNNDVEDFLKQLDRIERKEKKYHLQLAEDKNSLQNTVIASGGFSTIEQGRISFLDMLDSLESLPNRKPIDRDKKTMEDLAIIIAKHNKAARTAKNN